MSLDVYLEIDQPVARESREAIFVRRGGANVEISRAEWDVLNPGREPVTLAVNDLDERGRVLLTHPLDGVVTKH